jgi:transposase-like protein
MSYDKKYRRRTIEYHEEGHSIRKTAKTFGISPNTLNAWLKHIAIAEGLSENTEAIKQL